MKYRVAAIECVNHALASLTDDCIAGIGQKHRKNSKAALLPGELTRLKAKINDVIAGAKRSYPSAPTTRYGRRR